MNRMNVVCLGSTGHGPVHPLLPRRPGVSDRRDERPPGRDFFQHPGDHFWSFTRCVFWPRTSTRNPPAIGSGFGGITLAYNVRTKEEVMRRWSWRGVRARVIVKEPQDVFWGRVPRPLCRSGRVLLGGRVGPAQQV